MRATGSPANVSSRLLTRTVGFRILISSISIGCLAATGPNSAPKTFDFQTGPSPSVTISNLRGHVTVRGWEKMSVHAACTMATPQIEVDAEPMPASGAAERVQFATHVLNPSVTPDDAAADYILDVPAGTNLEVHNRQGAVRVEGLSGETWVESVSGTISVLDAAGHLDIHSVGGDVEITRPAGHVEASTITGNLKFIDPTSTNIRGTTTSGQILYQGDFAPGGQYVLSAYSGDMEIFCPASASFEIHAQTVKGHLDNGVDVIQNQHSGLPFGATGLVGKHNEAKARLDLRSYSGTIRLRTLR